MARQVRLGMLTPSSNTRLEPLTYRMLEGQTDVTAHFSRLRVTRIALDGDSNDQFDVGPMLAAAELLAEAKVDSLMWNGTSGSWLGPERDRELCRAVTEATGIPTSTSTLALFEALECLGATRLGLATPYTSDVTEAIRRQYAVEGIEVVADEHLGISDNESFGRVEPATVADLARRVGAQVDAVAVVCTNLDGASVAAGLERELGVPVIDSIAVTLWKGLRLAGADLRLSGWGSLLAGDPAAVVERTSEQATQTSD